jgi:hypothetical protein
MAQRRSTEVAVDYVTALGSGVKANCWSLAEAAGHDGQGRMQGLLGSYRWSWMRLRGELAGLAAVWIPDSPLDLIGPGIAIDETAQLKKGEATACVAAQHAGCTGTVDNCVTTVFSAYVTAVGQAWVDFDVYMPERWASDTGRRRTARIPEELTFATKPQLAMDQLDRQVGAGSPARWVAFDEVYGRSEPLRKKAAGHGLAYVGIIPCDYQIRLPSGAAIRAEQAIADAVFERRSCGNGTKGPRFSDWAMTTTVIPGQYLLIRRLLSRPDSYTFYLCWAPPDRPATMTYFITIAGRRWPVATGKDVFGWDQTQARSWDGICRHTALAALAQLRATAIRNTITAGITPPADTDTDDDTDDTDDTDGGDGGDGGDEEEVSDADLQIPLDDAPIPVRGGQPCPPALGPIKLSVAEATRLAGLAARHTQGLITRTRLAFALRWSLRRRLHQARARWHHYSTRLQAITDGG